MGKGDYKMPININSKLPAAKILSGEGIFVMSDEQALRQDIRPLKIVILNLMPLKIVTETQLLRRLSNSPLQIEITLLHPKTHISKNTSYRYLKTFYKTFDQIKDQKFDGMIITGAPIEHIEFEEVNYWDELVSIMSWSRKNVYSTMHICWGAQAGLYYHYGIPKHPLPQKLFGVFKHTVLQPQVPLMRGFDDEFYAPHSRHTEVRSEDIQKHSHLILLSESKEAGAYIICSRSGRRIFITGHSEYDPLTLRDEYLRDREKGLDIHMPENYFPDDDPTKEPKVKWRGHSNLLFNNWLNYYVYQATPFDLSKIQDETHHYEDVSLG